MLYVGTGKLRYLIEDRGERISVEDRPKLPLEAQLNEVVIALVRIAIEVSRPHRVAAEEDARRRAEQERLRLPFE